MKMTASNPSYNPQEDVEALLDKGWTIVVYNDEVNTFDWVILWSYEVAGRTVCMDNSQQWEVCSEVGQLRGHGAHLHGFV